MSRCQPDNVFQARPDDSFKAVALKILQNSVSTIPIINYPTADPSNPQLLHMASLSGILKCEQTEPTSYFSVFMYVTVLYQEIFCLPMEKEL